VETNPVLRPVELEGYRRWFARLALPVPEYQAVAGQVVLPPGSGLDLASLQVLGGQNASGVAADGGFRVFQPGGGPAPLALVSGNQPVLLGYVGAAGGGVGARSTANWLLFHAVGGYRLPPSTWQQALGWIDGSAEAQGLAGVIGQCVAANPLALAQGEPAIGDALRQAAGTLVRTNASPAPPARPARAEPEDLQAGSYLIEGPYPAQQTGLRCEHNQEGVGLVLVNDYRRHLMYFVYRVGHEDQQGVTHQLPAADWEPVTGINNYLPGVNAVEGVLPSLAGLLLGQVAYAPSKSPGIRLTVKPEDAKKVFYRVVAVGPAGEWGSIPEVLRTHPLRGQWDSAYQWMEGLEFAKEYVVPVVFAGLEAGNVGKTLGGRWKLGIELADTLSAAGLDLGAALRANQYDDALKVVIKELVTNENLREGMVKLAVNWGLVKATEAQAEALLEHMARILMIADAVVLGFDLALVSDHISRSFPFVYWDVTVQPPRVELEAGGPAANGREPVSLAATVTPPPDLANSFLKFHWTTGGQGTLRYEAGGIVKEGTDFEVEATGGSCSVTYRNRGDATHGATETVRVVAKRVDVGADKRQEVLVGEATAELFVINVAAALKPAESNLLIGETAALALKLEPAQPAELSNLAYTWTLDGNGGSLGGGGDLQRTYTAAAHGWDVVKVAVKGDYDGKTYQLAEARADVKVVPVRVTLRPDGPVMGQDRLLTLTAKVEPVPAEGHLLYRWQNSGPAGELIGGNDQQTASPTIQFHSSATVEDKNRVTVTAYLVTASGTDELGVARTDVVVQRSLQFPGLASVVLGLDDATDTQMPAVVYGSWVDGLNYHLAPGDGALQGPFNLAPARKFYGQLIKGDWNGDSRGDFVTAYAWWEETSPDESDWYWRIESWTRNDTNGFAPTTVWQGDGNQVQFLAAGDLDGDGDADLYVVYRTTVGGPWGNGDTAVARFINDGQGHFTRMSDIELPWQYHAGVVGMVLADIDSTNGLDLILGCNVNVPSPYNEHNGKHFLIFRNRGGGSLADPVRQQTTHPGIVQAADLNGDGDSDLVLGGRTTAGMDGATGAVFVLRNRGDGSFDPPDIYPKPGSPFLFFQTGVSLLDVDRDGDLDAIVFDESGNRILLNTGDGTF
jgi:hypothetical protein